MEELRPIPGSVTPREVATASRIRSQFEAGWNLGPEFDVKPSNKSNGSYQAVSSSAAAAGSSNSDPDSDYNGPWESTIIDGNQIDLPSDLLTLDNIYNLLSLDVWKSLTPEERDSLKAFLPHEKPPAPRAKAQAQHTDDDMQIDIEVDDHSSTHITVKTEPMVSDERADQIVESLLSGKLRNLGVSQPERFARELADGMFHAQVVKYKEKLEEQRRMKRLLHLKRHNMTTLRRVLEFKQRIGHNVEADLQEMEKLQLAFKEEDKRRLRLMQEQEALVAMASDDPTFVSPSMRNSLSAKRGGKSRGSTSSARAGNMIPRDLSAYDDEDLDGAVARELRSTGAAPRGSDAALTVGDNQIGSVAPAEPSEDQSRDELSVVSKKRKRESVSEAGSDSKKAANDELQPFVAAKATGDGPTAEEQAPKAKKPRVAGSRKDQKAANAAISLPIETFSLFKTIYKCLSASAPNPVSIEALRAEVDAEPRICLSLPGNISPETMIRVAMIYLSNPFSPIQSESCPKIAAPTDGSSWKLVPQQADAADVPSVLLPRLERFEPVFWLALTRGHYDLAKGEIFSQAVNKLLTGRAPATITELHTRTDSLAFQQQEAHRYSGADRAFEYVFNSPDGTVKLRSVVAPLKAQRGRESNFIRAERPPAVTLLSIMRDAVSRLPGGVGIRQDIPILLKDTQYLNQDPGAYTEQQFNQVISSSLDRIQAEIDSPLKYDNELKLWIYNHRQRTVADFDNYWARLKTLEASAPAQDSSTIAASSTQN